MQLKIGQFKVMTIIFGVFCLEFGTLLILAIFIKVFNVKRRPESYFNVNVTKIDFLGVLCMSNVVAAACQHGGEGFFEISQGKGTKSYKYLYTLFHGAMALIRIIILPILLG